MVPFVSIMSRNLEKITRRSGKSDSLLNRWLRDSIVSHLQVDLERKDIVDSHWYAFTAGWGTGNATNCLIDEVPNFS